MTPIPSYRFGIKIQLISKPLDVRLAAQQSFYYHELSRALAMHNEVSNSDQPDESSQARQDRYDRWSITGNASLGGPQYPQIPMEAVSPIFYTSEEWEDRIHAFWKSHTLVFNMPETNKGCASHIHVSPSNTSFRISELQKIEFGAIFYQPLIWRLLPTSRQESQNCLLNTECSDQLSQIIKKHLLEDKQSYDGAIPMLIEIRNQIRQIRTKPELRNFVQKSAKPDRDKYALWNFNNILWGGSGTIEFRGGKGLKGPAYTKRWISFVLSFVHLCLFQPFWQWGSFDLPSMERFWQDIRRVALRPGIQDNLDEDWRVLAECRREGVKIRHTGSQIPS